MGVVYHALDRETGRAVALKTLRQVDAQSIYRLKQEFRALSDLEHPNLLRFGELCCEQGRWFFTMELVEGPNFLEHVGGGPAASQEGRLRDALAQLVEGVRALHDAGRVHRDIKPSNVRVTSEGRVVLLDFGLATELALGQRRDPAAISDEDIVGTVAYMAPEQAAGMPPGPEADWYSVGVVLFEALTGKLPFTGAAIEIMMDKQRLDPPRPSSVAPAVPADLDALCVELLAFDPKRRPDGRTLGRRLGVSDGPPSARSTIQRRPFVGREAELAALRHAFDDSRRGQAVTVLVTGESGIGKSVLVRRFLEQLGEEAIILRGRCYQRESVPFKAFDAVVDDLSRHLSRLDQIEVALLLPREVALLARVFPVLKRVPAVAKARPPREDIGGQVELRARAFSALRELFRALSEWEPVVLFIDDLQWADADSLALFEDVMHGPQVAPVLLLAAIRTEEGAPARLEAAPAVPRPSLLPSLRASDPGQSLPGIDLRATAADVRILEIGRLSPHEAARLAEHLLAQGEVGADPAALAREGGGHPLFIHELVRHRDAAPASGAPLRLEDAIWSRIEQLDEPPRRLLVALAVAGAPLSQDAAGRAADLAPEACERAVALLRVAHLVRSSGEPASRVIEPFHDRVREAVLQHLDSDARRVQHGRLAGALEQEAPGRQDPRLLVRHWLAAGETARAAQHSERAAALAADALAFDQAAEFYRTALELGQRSPEQARVLSLQLAEALRDCGRGADAADAYLRAAEGAEPVVRTACRRAAAQELLVSGHVRRGLDTLASVLAEAGERLPPTRLAAILSLAWRRLQLFRRGYGYEPRSEDQVPADLLARIDLYRVVARGLAFVDSLRAADYQTRALMLSLSSGERTRVAWALLYECIFLITRGGGALRRARALFDRVQAEAEGLHDEQLRWVVRGIPGFWHYFSGDFRRASESLAALESARLAEPLAGGTFEMQTGRLFRLLALRHLGSFRELKRRFDFYLRDATRRGDRYSEASLARALGIRWLLSDEPAVLRSYLVRDIWSPPGDAFHLQQWYEIMARIDLALYEDDPVAERELHALFGPFERSMLLRVSSIKTHYCWFRGRLALRQAARGSARARREAARFARRLQREPAPSYAALGCMLAAGVAALRSDGERAVALLSEAAHGFEDQGMKLYRAAAQWRQGELLGGRAGETLVRSAGELMRAEEVADPERVVAMYAPGFAGRPLPPRT